MSSRQAVILTNDGLVYWRIYASLGFNGLTMLNREYVFSIRRSRQHRNSHGSKATSLFQINPHSLRLSVTNLHTLRPIQNGLHCPDDIFKCIFLNENVWISIKISLSFVLLGPINYILALVQIMAWCRTGNKPLPEPMLTQCTDARGEMSFKDISACCTNLSCREGHNRLRETFRTYNHIILIIVSAP